MALNILDFTTIVQNQVAAIQGRAAGLVDLTIGSLLRAIVEANAGVVQWLQQLVVQLLVTVRASTATGSDLDSWMADYGFTRLAAVAATGDVTFARYTATNQAVIPVGTTVTTSDGTQQYLVVANTANSAYSATLAGYILAAGVSSITVPVQAVTAGSAGNATAGTISVISGGIQYVDTVSNAYAFTTGSDAETDAAFRSRFILWVASLSKSTKSAIGYAISSLQSGVNYSLTENTDINGNSQPGYFYAVVDDGSGDPTETFLATVASAVEAVRPFSVTYGVFGPVKLAANVSMALTVSSGIDRSVAVQLVQTALNTYLSELTLGETLPYTQLAAIAYGASDYITNVSSIKLNNDVLDLTPTPRQVIRPGTITVS